MLEALFKSVGGKLGIEAGRGTTNEKLRQEGTSTSKLNIDQAGLNKIIQDVLGSEQGLAALVQGQNTAGLHSSSTNTLLAQKFVTDLAGELAKLTAETVETSTVSKNTDTKAKSSKGKTVICTELERQGLLDTELYEAGHSHFLSLSPQTVRGYRVWANRVVPLMQKSPRLSRTLAPIANSRYEHVTGRRKNLVGWITVHICQPICYLIGFFVPEGEEYDYQAAVH